MFMKKTLLFVSHEADLSGAPILLLNIISWIKKNTDYKVVVVLAKSGPLKEQFAKVADVIEYYSGLKLSIAVTILRRIGILEHYYRAKFRWLIRKKTINLVFANTIVNGNLVEKSVIYYR